MNCRGFEEAWDDLLDARSEPRPDLEEALRGHAEACPRCRASSVRLQVLRRAVAALRPPPAPSAASIGRLYALTVPSNRPTVPIRRPGARAGRLIRVAAAAAAFALATLGGGWRPSGEPEVARGPLLRPPGVPTPALGRSLAEATEATIDLAFEVSAPASRIGREVLDLGTAPAPVPGPGPVPEARGDLEAAPSDLFRSVGRRIGAGVKPISGSARHAFSFLIGEPGTADPAPKKQQDSL